MIPVLFVFFLIFISFQTKFEMIEFKHLQFELIMYLFIKGKSWGYCFGNRDIWNRGF